MISASAASLAPARMTALSPAGSTTLWPRPHGSVASGCPRGWPRTTVVSSLSFISLLGDLGPVWCADLAHTQRAITPEYGFFLATRWRFVWTTKPLELTQARARRYSGLLCPQARMRLRTPGFLLCFNVMLRASPVGCVPPIFHCCLHFPSLFSPSFPSLPQFGRLAPCTAVMGRPRTRSPFH